ncbi:MAG: tyrosine-protein phosphatase [Treponema sp.]|nr:tyrosine-protein phosphatase [Treponema sp.]
MEIIKLKHIKNFRDLGGVQTTDGKTVKSHMLFRGTTLTKLTKKDVAKLKDENKLATVIDLRTKKETIEIPNEIIDGVQYLHMPILEEAMIGVSHEKKVHSIRSLELMPKMEEMYVRMVTDQYLDHLVDALRTILTFPMERYAVVFHCSAGKDRTGILAALILAFLGVDKETIIQDYLVSNKFNAMKARFVYLGCLALKRSHKFAKKVKYSLLAKRIFIESALNTLEENFGTLDNFFKLRLNFSEKEVEEIRNKFLY